MAWTPIRLRLLIRQGRSATRGWRLSHQSAETACAYPHVRHTPMGRTCRQASEIKKGTHATPTPCVHIVTGLARARCARTTTGGSGYGSCGPVWTNPCSDASAAANSIPFTHPHVRHARCGPLVRVDGLMASRELCIPTRANCLPFAALSFNALHKERERLRCRAAGAHHAARLRGAA